MVYLIQSNLYVIYRYAKLSAFARNASSTSALRGKEGSNDSEKAAHVPIENEDVNKRKERKAEDAQTKLKALLDSMDKVVFYFSPKIPVIW